jgi:hypothetical protein
MNKYYQIAGHVVCCSGDKLCMAVNRIEGFHPFAWQGEPSEVSFTFAEGQEVPDMQEELYPFVYEDVQSSFGRTTNGYLLVEKPAAEEAFYMWCDSSRKVVYLSGNWSLRLYRFAMWLGYGLMTLPEQTLAIHSSCIVYQNQAVLFLGESGTGKSTHTRLWREHIEGAVLLNDDSPILRVEDGKVWVYGSPWSGKTPCYKAERYELKGCVRLSQAPHNRIRKLSILEAYGAIHPSCAPEFAYDDLLYDEVSHTLGQILRGIPIYHLECLPNSDAAHLSSQTIFSCY